MFKICPRCGDEFVPHVEVCPDCRVPLQASDGAPPVPRAAEAPAPLALESAVALQRGTTSELRQIAEALGAAGVACAIDTDPPGGVLRGAPQRGRTAQEAPLAVFVDERDAAEARRVLGEWLASAIPGSEHAAAAGSIDACPGCGEPLPEHPTACASCGLEFPPLELPCPRCGQAVAAEAESCAACGHRP
jgi:hypothetical protein